MRNIIQEAKEYLETTEEDRESFKYIAIRVLVEMLEDDVDRERVEKSLVYFLDKV